MSTSRKFWLGLLTVAPIPLFGMYIYSIFEMMTSIATMENAGHETMPLEFFQNFGTMFLYIGLAAIIGLIAMILYILDIVKNNKFVGTNSSMKVVWILIVILLSTIGMIVYFIVEIIPRKEGEDYYAPPITERTN